MIADAHVHLFGAGYAGSCGGVPAKDSDMHRYERLRRRHRIERSLVVGYEGDAPYVGNNGEILASARTRSWMVPLAYVSVRPPPAVAHLACLLDDGFRGISVYLRNDDGGAFAAWSDRAFELLAERRTVVSINAGPRAIASITHRVPALAGASVLFSHLGLPGRFAGSPAAPTVRERLAPVIALVAQPHAMVKLSALYAISDPAHDFPHRQAQPFVDAILDAFGPHRVLWGSDFPPALDEVSFAQLVDRRALAGYTDAEADAVMGGNLLRLVADLG